MIPIVLRFALYLGTAIFAESQIKKSSTNKGKNMDARQRKHAQNIVNQQTSEMFEKEIDDKSDKSSDATQQNEIGEITETETEQAPVDTSTLES